MRRPTTTILLLSLLFAAALPTAAEASLSRIRALGGPGDYLEDDHNVLRWYGSLGDYGRQCVFELGDYDLARSLQDHAVQGHGRSAGVHFDLGRGFGSAAVYMFSALPGRDGDGSIAGLWSRPLGPVLLGVYAQGSSYSVTEDSQDAFFVGESNYHHSYGLGARWNLGENLYADVAGEIVNTQFDMVDAGRDVFTPDIESTWDTFGLRARVFLRLSETLALVPLVDHRKDDRKTSSAVLRDGADLDARRTRLGWAVNIYPDPDTMVLFSAEYERGKHDLAGFGSEFSAFLTSEERYFRVVTRFGAESRVLPWLTLRGSAAYRRLDDEILRLKPRDADTPIYEDLREVTVRVDLDFGLALHLGSVDVDLIVSDDEPAAAGPLLDEPRIPDEASWSSLSVTLAF